MLKRIALLSGLIVAVAACPTRAADPAPAAGSGAAAVERRVESAGSAHVQGNTAAGAAHADDAHGDHGTKYPLLPADANEAKLFVPTAVWTLIIFGILLLILYPTAWKQVLGGLKAREEKIRKDIADAEAARTRAETTLREYNAKLADAEARTRDILARASADAEKLATSIRMQAQQEAEEAKERAMKDIDAARRDAVREVYEQTAVLATSVAEKILRRNLNPQDQRDLVDQSLSQLQSAAR